MSEDMEETFGKLRALAKHVRNGGTLELRPTCRCDSLRSYVCPVFTPCQHVGGHEDMPFGWCERCGHWEGCHAEQTTPTESSE